MRRRIVRHFALYLPSQVAPRIVQVVSLPILARLLSPSEFGRLALALALVGGGRLLFGWLENAVLRFYPGAEEGGTSGWLRTVLLAYVSIAVAACAATLALAPSVAPGHGALVIVGVFVFVERSLYGLLAQFLRARLEPGRFTRFVVWENAGGLLLGAALVYALGLGPEGVLAGYGVAGAVALPRLWRRALPAGALAGRASPQQLQRMAAVGVPLTVSQLGLWALRRIDRFQIQVWYGAAAVGSYTVPYLVAQHAIVLFSSTLRATSFPLTADAWERRGAAAGLGMLEATTRMYLLAALPLWAGISVLARPAVHVLGGPEYVQGWAIVPWVAAGVFFLGLQQRFQNALILAERAGAVMTSVGIAALANIALNALLLPRLGFEIAAVTTFASCALSAGLLALACQRHVPWRFPWASAVRALASAAGMAIVLQLLRAQLGTMSPLLDLVVSVPAGVLAYGVLLRLTGESDLAELRAALSAGLGRWARPPARG
jgi:O-antigen/teichoic acid export membrane protein